MKRPLNSKWTKYVWIWNLKWMLKLKRIMKTKECRWKLLWVKSYENIFWWMPILFSDIETSKSDLQASIVLFVHCQNWDYFHQKIIQRESPQNVRTATARDLSRKNCLQHSNAWQKKELFKAKGRSTWSTLALRRIEKRPLLKTSRNLWETGDVNRVRIAEIVNYFAVCCLGYGEFWWITSYSGVPDRTLLLLFCHNMIIT